MVEVEKSSVWRRRAEIARPVDFEALSGCALGYLRQRMTSRTARYCQFLSLTVDSRALTWLQSYDWDVEVLKEQYWQQWTSTEVL